MGMDASEMLWMEEVTYEEENTVECRPEPAISVEVQSQLCNGKTNGKDQYQNYEKAIHCLFLCYYLLMMATGRFKL